MIEPAMIVSWLLTGAIRTEVLKSKQLNLEEVVKNKIKEEGLYHITTKEAAEQIVKSGYILPTKGVIDNHFTKSRYGDKFADLVYMFAGKPTIETFKNNLCHRPMKDGTIYAVKHTPDQYDINNYTERLEDGAITHEGRLDITNSKPELVRMKIEKGQLIEIPWNEPVKTSFLHKIGELKTIKMALALPGTFKELNRNVTFRDKEGKLKRTMQQRRDENKMLQQYNSDASIGKEIQITKNGITYIAKSIGTKINDGKPLTGFRISQAEGEFTKNIFTDAIDLTQISSENITQFLSEYMNEESEQTEYIGKPAIKKGQMLQEIDKPYAEHFYKKQLMQERNDATYAQHMGSTKGFKSPKLDFLKKAFESKTATERKSATRTISAIQQKKKEFIQGNTSKLAEEERS